MSLNLKSVLNFGKHRGLTIAEVLDEPFGFDYLFWVLNNLYQIQFSSELEIYIKTTVQLRAKDRKLNPQNYLHEKTLKDLKAIAMAIDAIPISGRNKLHYIEAIQKRLP